MSTLVAIGYPDETTAEQAQKTVQELQSELIIQASQIAAISRGQKGDYRVHTNYGAEGAGAGAMWHRVHSAPVELISTRGRNDVTRDGGDEQLGGL